MQDRNGQLTIESLYCLYRTGVYGYCLRMTGNRSDAEDLTQDTFVAAMQGLHRVRSAALVKAWIYKTACHKVRRHIRRRRFAALIGYEPAGRTDGFAMVELDIALATLSPLQREAVLLVKAEGLSLAEAAVALGVPEGTVKTRVYDGIKRLQALETAGLAFQTEKA
jgi:RNA polymerase sigma-70 factor (ECF subfamily)